MLTMLVGGPANGKFLEVEMDAPVVYMPTPWEPNFGPRDDPPFQGPSRETYEHKTFVFEDQFGVLPPWREDVFVHTSINRRLYPSEMVGITMRLWREWNRRKVISETPEYVLRVWREDGIKC